MLISETTLHDVRFSADRELFEQLSSEQADRFSLASLDQHRKSIRRQLLSSAVRVNPRMLPKLDASIRALRERAGYADHVEAYVFEGAEINAFLTKGLKHTYLGLSSGAVNTLSEAELEFVIGHELGHALFQHIDTGFTARLQHDNLEGRLQQRLLSWMRASEISADRCGLICSGSIDVAASAMFRTLSGLSNVELVVQPEDFSEQWDHLLEEVIQSGANDLWQTSHPYPPMRMRAMTLFWRSDCAALPDDRPSRDLSLTEVDREVQRILATIDPLARRTHDVDPLLEDLMLWGGLLMAHADGESPPVGVLEELRRVTPGAASFVDVVTTTRHTQLERFRDCLKRRHRRLKPLEIHRLLTALLGVVHVKGSISEAEFAAFRELGGILGIEEHACAIVRDRFVEQRDAAATAS